MPIYDAIFRKNEKEEVILLDSIESHPNYDEVKNNLYCSFEDCQARLEYVPKGKKIAYFKTWPKHDHTTDCIDYFEREKKANSERNSASISMELSDKHIADILNDIKRKRNESKKTESEIPKRKRIKKNKEVDPSLPKNVGLNINPTTGGDADVKEGEIKVKAPSVRRRTMVLLNEDDINFTRAFHNVTIENVEVSEDRVVIGVSDGNKTCNIYFEEYFFTSAPVNFINRFNILAEIDFSEEKLQFSCVGKVDKRDEQICLLIDKNTNFRVEDLYLPVFLDNRNYGK